MKRKVLALACTLALSAGLLAGCGSSTDTAAEAESTVAAVESTEAAEAESAEAESTETAAEVESKGTITVAATPVPHAEILEAAKDLMAAEGWDLEIVEFTDYVQPNEVVESGDVDANYFQHVNYLNSYNEEKGTHLAIAGKIHYEPLGLYPGKQSDLDAITDGAEIAVPNDTTNCARALLLLEAEGLIKLDPEAGITATENDIIENPHNIKIVPLAAEQVARTLEDVDFGVINGNYAMEAGLTSADAVARESADSEAIQQFEKQEMIVVCKPEDSKMWFDKLWQNTVDLFRSMDIPVRTLECCSGDLADLKVKSVDVEAWSPRQKKYFEVGSCSNLGDAQARRLQIRVKGEDGKKYLAHTLNNTVVAPPRMLIAFLENNLQADGRVRIPEKLRPYMGGKEYLEKTEK